MSLESVKGHVDLLLLSTLEQGPAHGYAVVERLTARSGGELSLPEGTVYPALHRLERQGLLRSRWDEDAPRRRRVYELTPAGRRALGEQRARWSTFRRAVEAVVGGAA